MVNLQLLLLEMLTILISDRYSMASEEKKYAHNSPKYGAVRRASRHRHTTIGEYRGKGYSATSLEDVAEIQETAGRSTAGKNSGGRNSAGRTETSRTAAG